MAARKKLTPEEKLIASSTELERDLRYHFRTRHFGDAERHRRMVRLNLKAVRTEREHNGNRPSRRRPKPPSFADVLDTLSTKQFSI